jgi:hypothetical protein
VSRCLRSGDLRPYGYSAVKSVEAPFGLISLWKFVGSDRRIVLGYFAGSEAFTAVTMKNVVFWDIKP